MLWIHHLFNLPDSLIQLEIRPFLTLTESLNLAGINVETATKWMKKWRLLRGVNDSLATKMIESRKFSNLIIDPYHQLSLVHPYITETTGSIDCAEELVLQNLFTTMPKFLNCFIKKIKRLQNLIICKDNDGIHSGDDVTEAINRKEDYGLKHLTLSGCPMKFIFPLIGLESLTLLSIKSSFFHGSVFNGYSSLRTLELFYCPIIDVNALDRIHGLILERCHKIADISGLNHNKKIVIKRCDKITDFSNSFQFSSSVKLLISCPQVDALIPPNLQRMEKIQSFSIELLHHHQSMNGLFTLPFPPSLKMFEIINCDALIALPVNSLREVTISYCSNFSSLQNMNHISSITLQDLNLVTLHGLCSEGSKNRFIHIVRCNLLIDFRALNGCENVFIKQCQWFNDPNHHPNSKVSNVKTLSITPYKQDFNQWKGLEDVHLILEPTYNGIKETTDLSNVKTVKTHDVAPSIYRHFMKCFSIKRIVIKTLVPISIFKKNENKSDGIVSELAKVFHSEKGSRYGEIVLTRR